ncbi:MAG: XRE family transcriptional regulator [Firmicutes bacterium]|nr:XRE family transcriptional regulator [Bacillota bacterium]MCM1400410.1 XRE family transcriptional regulator [Bacteroides sp.]MCM1477167.1 XRE family transcriptional regulator [Bacteroides sp.]
MIREISIGAMIEAELHRQERTTVWFARKLGCNRTNAYKIFKRQSIDTELLLKISQILQYDFFSVYSRKLAPPVA